MSHSVPLDGSGSGSFTIPEIIDLASEGSIRVPTFQRHFAWRGLDVRRLFDSIYRGFPIGTLLLWRQKAESGKISLGPIEFEVPSRSTAYWVVDGQQRITSLFAALSPAYKTAADQFEIYFDLETQEFITPRHGTVPPRAIPVREAIGTRSLLQWLRTHSEELESDDLELADKLGGALRDYRIPAYIVSGDNQALLREVFDRVNSAGKPISRAQVFHALFAGGDEPGSPASVVSTLGKLGFGQIDEGRVVQSLLAIRGGDVQRDIRSEFSTDEHPSEWFDHTEQALTRTIEFMRNDGIPHQLLMPNTLPFPVLAAFFHLHPDPQPWSKRLLSRWLWRGWVHGFGREGGQTPVLRRAIRSVNPDLRSSGTEPSEYEALRSLLEFTPDREAPSLSMQKFNTRDANSRLILLALASLDPLDQDGRRIDLSAEFERHGSEAVTQLTPKGRTFAAGRGFWPVSATSIVSVENQATLQSHLIDRDGHYALATKDYDDFLERREISLRHLVGSFLDSRLEPGRITRPPLRELAAEAADNE